MRRLADAAKFLLDRTLVRLLRYLRDRVSPASEAEEDVFKLVKRRAVASSADYVESRLDQALLFPNRELLWDFALSKAPGTGLYAEFGVFTGWSINRFARRLAPRGLTIHGFDSFQGLREDWPGTWYAAGHFDLGGKLPRVLPNVALIKGWFDDTVPAFLAAHPEPLAFLHLDADTYESTRRVLALVGERIVAGTVVVLDEYIGFPNWRKGEFLAWQEFVAAHGLAYRYLAFSVTQAAVQVL